MIRRLLILNAGRIFILLAAVFALLETWYFGWNRSAHSDAELYCDAASIFALLVGIGLHVNERKRRRSVERIAKLLEAGTPASHSDAYHEIVMLYRGAGRMNPATDLLKKKEASDRCGST